MGGGVGCRSGHNTQEAAEELRDLAGDATYRQLLERHPDVTNMLLALPCSSPTVYLAATTTAT